MQQAINQQATSNKSVQAAKYKSLLLNPIEPHHHGQNRKNSTRTRKFQALQTRVDTNPVQTIKAPKHSIQNYLFEWYTRSPSDTSIFLWRKRARLTFMFSSIWGILKNINLNRISYAAYARNRVSPLELPRRLDIKITRKQHAE